MVRVLLSVTEGEQAAYRAALAAAADARGMALEFAGAQDPPADVDYLVCAPDGPVRDFEPYAGVKAVLSLWAGVERFLANETLTAPLCRMSDTGLVEGMTEYVTGHVLRYHLGLDAYLAAQDGVWRDGAPPPLARERRVTMLGLGALGGAAADALAGLNFDVTGWSRTAQTRDGVRCLHAAEGLRDALAAAEIVVTLLPATAQTRNLIDAGALAGMRRGVRLINPGRGTLIDDDALLAALDAGQVAHATLDVFRTEPLPADHPFWAHPKVTVTPHIAAATRPESAADAVLENIARGESGQAFLHRVDRGAGY